jgi:hypothetical protein
VPDKAKALREVARILRAGAPFAGTVFELHTPSAALALPAFVDYPGAFSAAGFTSTRLRYEVSETLECAHLDDQRALRASRSCSDSAANTRGRNHGRPS